MSTLMVLLAAGMAMGSGPEMVSGEVEPRLDLRGEWEGTWETEITNKGGAILDEKGVLHRYFRGREMSFSSFKATERRPSK